jgi:hypothetical protein
MRIAIVSIALARYVFSSQPCPSLLQFDKVAADNFPCSYDYMPHDNQTMLEQNHLVA